ncbi:MAG: hypothetical protein ACI87E_001394 [Mariniblastus sp.]|jgi:hypothetical protein
MYPHERSLVKQLAGKPFAIVGVNSDRDREVLKKVLDEKNLTWRSFWGGQAIAKEWNVKGWPTTYVLDAEGVIRYKGARGAKLDAAIETLLAEVDVEVEIDDDHEVIGKLAKKEKKEEADDSKDGEDSE